MIIYFHFHDENYCNVASLSKNHTLKISQEKSKTITIDLQNMILPIFSQKPSYGSVFNSLNNFTLERCHSFVLTFDSKIKQSTLH